MVYVEIKNVQIQILIIVNKLKLIILFVIKTVNKNVQKQLNVKILLDHQLIVHNLDLIKFNVKQKKIKINVKF